MGTTTWTQETNLPGKGRSLSNIDTPLESCEFALEDAWTPAATTWTEETYIA